MKLYVILLCVISTCFGQFSIQGPNDGNRQAQGLKINEDGGVEYGDHSASLGTGDFNIQGATDGNTGFNIQGATDGHSNFQIQGAIDDGASRYHNVQGPIDGGLVQYNNGGAYDANQQQAPAPRERALNYKDPSGLRVNWRSYNHDRQPQGEPEYAQETAVPAPQPIPRQRAHRPRVQEPPPQPQPNYKFFDKAPPQIQQLLQFQQQIPYINSIPEPYRYDGEGVYQAMAQQAKELYQKATFDRYSGAQEQQQQQQQQQQPIHRGKAQRPKREALPQQHRRIPQPPAEPAPHYSTNLPSKIQEILKFQAQVPYNIIANTITYRLDKPYVPQSVASSQPSQSHYQPQLIQNSQYQGQPQYQGLGYPEKTNVRPVTES